MLRDKHSNSRDPFQIGMTMLKWIPWVLTIYMGKPEISVGKSNGSRHSDWKDSENMGCDLR